MQIHGRSQKFLWC